MTFFTEGDKSKAICGACKGVRGTTFAFRNVPFSDGIGTADNILVGVCDECGEVASIPAQSTPAISKARSKATESIEAMLPAPYFDLLNLACFKIDPSDSLSLRKGLLMLYVHRFADGSFDLARLTKQRLPSMELGHKRRLSLKTSERGLRELDLVVERSALQKTEAIKAIIGAMQEDIVDDGAPELIRGIREFSVLALA